MAQKLIGKTALVTGSSAGIGWATALALAEEGANLVLNARREDRLRELAKLALDKGASAVTIMAGDAREEQVAKDCVDAALKTYGALDILINNIGMGIYKDLVDTSVDDYTRMIDTNIRTTFLFSRYAVPHMIERRQGTILMISSMAGLYGFAGEAVYCSTKFAQVGFAQALDRELRPKGIKVGVICPGGVKTEFAIGAGRTLQGVADSSMLEPEDVAQAVLLACTQSASSRIIEIQMRTMSEALA